MTVEVVNLLTIICLGIDILDVFCDYEAFFPRKTSCILVLFLIKIEQMKKLFLLLVLTFLVVSCTEKSNDEVVASLQNKDVSSSSFFKKASSLTTNSKDKVLLISYEYDAGEDKMKLLSVEEVDPSWGIAFDVLGTIEEKNSKHDNKHLKRENFAYAKDEYSVKCVKNGHTTEVICSGKFTCGKAVYDCVQEGGCATVCKAYAVYAPEAKSFYVSNDLKDLLDEK